MLRLLRPQRALLPSLLRPLSISTRPLSTTSRLFLHQQTTDPKKDDEKLLPEDRNLRRYEGHTFEPFTTEKVPNAPVTVDTELPNITSHKMRRWAGFGLFVAIMTVSLAFSFNYEKMSSSQVSSCMYTLRKSPLANEELGSGIRFASAYTWVSGTIRPLVGKVDFSFPVKGSKAEAVMHFNSRRATGREKFRVLEWSLTFPDGRVVNLADSLIDPLIIDEEEHLVN